MVELIVVLVIVGILAAIGIPTATHFIHLAEFRKNEENAKTAYLAAESALTWYRNSGEWEEFCEKVIDCGTPNNTFDGGEEEKNGRIYALSLNSGNQKEKDAAMELLDGGISSKDFFDAAITLEIDTKTGQIYSAFYATRSERLAYDGTDTDGVLNISAAGDNRAYDNRRGRLLGYYSAEDVVNVVELKPVRLKVTTLKLVNNETLSLNWSSNSQHNNLDVKFAITFYNNKDGKELFATEIKGDVVKKGIDEGQNVVSQMLNLELMRPKGESTTEKEPIGKWSFPLNYQSGGSFSLVLDGMMTAELMELLEAESSDELVAQQYSTSITRLGKEVPALKDPLDIYATVQVLPDYSATKGDFKEYKSSSVVKSNVENTLYAKSKEKDDGIEAEVSKFRHLSNIRYYNKDKSAEFTLTARNLDWLGVGVGMYGMENSTEEGTSGRMGVQKLTWNSVTQGNEKDALDFPSIELLHTNHTFQGGVFTAISNLKLGAASVPDNELTGKLWTDTSQKEKQAARYLGLFCEIEGTVKNLTLSNPTLTLASLAGEGAGAQQEPGAVENFDSLYGVGILAGRSQGTLDNISIKTTEKDRRILTVCLKDRTEGQEDQPQPAGIGGLVGVLAGKNDDGRTLESLNKDASHPLISNLTVQGEIVGRLPAPDAGISQAEGETGEPEEKAVDYTYGIGGIFGYVYLGETDAAAADRAQIEKCVNHASVTGNLFTGGLAGYIRDNIEVARDETGNVTGPESVKECKNDGLILCSVKHEDEEGVLEGRYFGGLVGFGHKVQINDSASASGRAKGYKYDYSQRDTVLLGQYVGGIIGYGSSSQLAGCKTEKGGYVLGCDYVGGIAGGLSNDAYKAIAGSAGIAVTTNAGYVIGNSYVGGIVGKNNGDERTTITNCINNGIAAGYERYIGGIVGYNGDKGYLLDCASYISDYNGALLNTIVKDWKATGDCSGGLVGYNNGAIKFTEDSQSITVKSVSSIVVGKDYVGGVIGFNDIKGTLDVKYTLIGGQIQADGNAVGGCIGLNASTELLSQELSIKPVSVTGNYWVGGCIGANVVDLVKRTREDTDGNVIEKEESEPSDVAMTAIKADNSLGKITGKAFTGGVIGYQRTYRQEQLNQAAGISGTGENISLLKYLDGAKKGEQESGADAGEKKTKQGTFTPLLPELDETEVGGEAVNIPTQVLRSDNLCVLTIGDKDNTNELFTANNIPIYCDLYTGGIVGYCERNSELVIVNCRNSARLSRREETEDSGSVEGGAGMEDPGSVKSAARQVSLKAYLGSGEVNADVSQIEEDIKVSIGGGIIGANLDHQIIDHCENTGIMNGFIGLGGIVGFNAGGVFNCELSGNFGNAGLNYIGGIVGLNVQADSAEDKGDGSGRPSTGKRLYEDVNKEQWDYASGMVASCSTREGIDISGRSFVGGIAGYNLSRAKLCANINRANVTAVGDYAGGVAGANLGEIDIPDCTVVKSAEGNGQYTITGKSGQGIGGIVGWNRTYIKKTGDGEDTTVSGVLNVAVGENETIKNNEVVAVGEKVTVIGQEKVGGIIGINEGRIDTSQGDEKSAYYLVCRAKLVQATKDCAGGIIGEARVVADGGNSGNISRAINRAERVTADNGRAGGIVAVNQPGFSLEECKNVGKEVNSDNGYAGGIAAENYGQILLCTVGDKDGQQDIEISSQGVDAIGAICAVNYGKIWNSGPIAKSAADGKPVKEVILSGNANLVGGIVGRNATFAGNVDLGMEASAGEIGIMDDSLTDGREVTYMPKVQVTAAALTVGGVAGRNEWSDRLTAKILDITVSGLQFEEYKNYRYLGAVAGENQGNEDGVNLAGEQIKGCHVSGVRIKQTSGSEAGNCYGGIVGKNSGRLEECTIGKMDIEIMGVYTATATSTAQEKENLASHVGGIAGKNEESGEIIRCLIEQRNSVNAGTENIIKVASGMAGGIAGYNKGIITLSGDAVTEELMLEGDSRITRVKDLIKNAGKPDIKIKADINYVGWNKDGSLEGQKYSGTNVTVSEGRDLSLIISDNGNLGGITAYNAPTGKVDYCATGNWYLNNKSETLGVGTGGIIGMNESENNLSFLLNRAFVGREIKTGTTNRFAGGIIGNQNNTTRSGWTIQNCINYGTVYCRNTHYSGGILGQWTGMGGSIESCFNYGNLQTTYAEGWVGAAGGIVAQLYHAYEGNEYNITSCGNFGNIYGRNGQDTANCANDSAGILGNVTAYRVENPANGQKYTINVIDCINGAGVEIYSASMASGIVGFFSCDNADYAPIINSTSNIILNIEGCRNYAKKLQGTNYIAGIFGERYGESGSQKTTLKYCFSVNSANYNKENCPVVSYEHPSNKDNVGGINGDDTNIYNYFLSDNTITSFLPYQKQSEGWWPTTTTSYTIEDNQQNTALQRANSSWVYSVPRNGKRYFIYMNQWRNNIDTNDLSLPDNMQAGNVVKLNNGTEVGHLLFTAPDTYSSIDSVTGNTDSARKFDDYVRTFCIEEAGMTLAPEKVTLTKTESIDQPGDGNPFTIKVSPPESLTGDVSYVATVWRKSASGEADVIIPIGNIQGVTQATGSGVPENAFTFQTLESTFSLSKGQIEAGGEIYVKVQAVKEGSSLSAEVPSNLVAIGNTLPDPEIVLELIENAGNYAYRVALTEENRDNYAKLGLKLKVSIKLMDGTLKEFDVSGSEIITLGAPSLQQLVVKAYSVDNDGKADSKIASSEVSVPVYLPAYTPQISLDRAVPTYTVTGTSLDNLRIQVTIPGSGGNITTPPVYRAELIGTWKNGTESYTETVFQSADILTTASGAATAVFTDLPAYMATAEDIQLRVWYAESGLGPVYTYSNLLADGVTEVTEENANIKRLIEVTEEPDGTLTPKWEYAYTPVWTTPVETGNTFRNYRWTSGKLLTLLPAPVLMDNADVLNPTTDDADGHLQYTFTWDKGKDADGKDQYQQGYKYVVSLTGIIRDENGEITGRVSLLTNQEMPKKENGVEVEPGNSLTVDAENWSYGEVELSVTRKGDTSNPNNIQIGLTSTKIYKVKRRLPQPAQPSVINPDSNELNYEIKWAAITPEEGCKFYEIYVRPFGDDGKPGTGEKLAEDIPVRDDEGNPVAVDGVYETLVSLEEYAGQKVQVYIKAYPDLDDDSYVHSIDGVTFELEVPKRLDPPTIEKWEKNWDHKNEEGEIKTIEEFEEGGLTVSVTADAESIPPGGSTYLIKAYVFDTSENAEKAKEALEKLDGAGTNMEELGAVAVYPAQIEEGEEIPASMEAIGTDGKLYSHDLFGLSAEYAGKYIIFRTRISSGQGNVSSAWVTNPDIWQLPYVQLPTPDVVVANGSYEIDVTLVLNPDAEDADSGNSSSKASEKADTKEDIGEDEKKNAEKEEELKNKKDSTLEDGEIKEEADPDNNNQETEEGSSSVEDESEDGNDSSEDKTEDGKDSGEDKTEDGKDSAGDKAEDGNDSNEDGTQEGKEDSKKPGENKEIQDSTLPESSETEDGSLSEKEKSLKEGKLSGTEVIQLSTKGTKNRGLPHEGIKLIRERLLAAEGMYRKDAFKRLVLEDVPEELDDISLDEPEDDASNQLEDTLPNEPEGDTSDELDDSLPEEQEDASDELKDGLSEELSEDEPDSENLIEVYAGEATEEGKWTAGGIGTSLTWESVMYADAYQIDLTSEEETQPGTIEDVMRELRIHENPEGADEKITVFRNNNGTWEEISEIAGKAGEYELYQHHVEGMYERAIDSEVPYRTDLRATLKVEELLDGEGNATGKFLYTLLLPDADSLTPQEGGNEIKNDEDNRLRFTKLVEIYSDLQENEEAPVSEAYVRSEPYVMEYQIN